MHITLRINIGNQAGTALVFSLMLLLILTLLGISSMNNTLMQERMAANARSQTSLFEATSAGVSDAVNFAFEKAHWPSCDDADDFFCEEGKKICGHPGNSLEAEGDTLDVTDPANPDNIITAPGWISDWYPADGENVDNNNVGGFKYKQRMYCLGDHEAKGNLSQLFVLTRGFTEDTDALDASREIEVRVGRRIRGDFPPPPISALDSFDGNDVGPASSNAMSVVGECGPAVVTSSRGDADLFESAVGDDRIGNYSGGIQPVDKDSGFGDPWDDPVQIRSFIESILPTLGKASKPDSDKSIGAKYDCTADASICDFSGSSDKTAFGTKGDEKKDVLDLSTVVPQITYFNGDASMGGNVSGAGIMIVEGNLSWQGTPQFDGLIVVLGGKADFRGGGGGGANGSLIISDVNSSDDDGIDLRWGPEKDSPGAGGGKQSWKANCSLLELVAGLLPEGEGDEEGARDMWQFQCDCPEITFGDSELMITSWRENIGWRDDEFMVTSAPPDDGSGG